MKTKIIIISFGIFQNPTKVVNKYNEHAVTGDTNPEKINYFLRSQQ